MSEILFSETDRAVREEARAFAREVPTDLIRRMDGGEVHYPREFVVSAAQRRLLGLRFDPAVGGRGLPWTAEVAAIEEVGVLGAPLACLYSLPSIVGEGIALFGSPELNQRYLAPTLAGEKFCAEALTEPRGGSDFFGATTTARQDGDLFVLNGQKRFIVGGQGADYFLVYARTRQDGAGRESLSAFLVDRHDNLIVEEVYGLMGTRGGGTARIVFRDVPVPARNLIGGLHQGAAVFNRMMVPERLTSAAGALGIARGALEVAARYADRRKAFGQKIRSYQAVSFKVAECVTRLDAGRALVYAAARTADSGADARRIVSEAKRFATQAAWDNVNDAMQILGGIGYTDIFPIERLMRDARLSMIWTGTNEIMNLLIQHEYFREFLSRGPAGRDIEPDALGAHKDAEKVFE